MGFYCAWINGWASLFQQFEVVSVCWLLILERQKDNTSARDFTTLFILPALNTTNFVERNAGSAYIFLLFHHREIENIYKRVQKAQNEWSYVNAPIFFSFSTTQFFLSTRLCLVHPKKVFWALCHVRSTYFTTTHVTFIDNLIFFLRAIRTFNCFHLWSWYDVFRTITFIMMSRNFLQQQILNRTFSWIIISLYGVIFFFYVVENALLRRIISEIAKLVQWRQHVPLLVMTTLTAHFCH